MARYSFTMIYFHHYGSTIINFHIWFDLSYNLLLFEKKIMAYFDPHNYVQGLKGFFFFFDKFLNILTTMRDICENAK